MLCLSITIYFHWEISKCSWNAPWPKDPGSAPHRTAQDLVNIKFWQTTSLTSSASWKLLSRIELTSWYDQSVCNMHVILEVHLNGPLYVWLDFVGALALTQYLQFWDVCWMCCVLGFSEDLRCTYLTAQTRIIRQGGYSWLFGGRRGYFQDIWATARAPCITITTKILSHST